MNKEIELFKELTKEEMKQLFKISSFKQYKKNNILFFEGDKPQQLFLLLDGIVKVYKVDTKGSEIILHFFQPQTLIAETAHIPLQLCAKLIVKYSKSIMQSLSKIFFAIQI